MRRRICLVVLAALSATPIAAQRSSAPPPAGAQRISYGTESTSWGELLLPSGNGPFPLAVLLHGGCWVSTQGNVDQMRPLATLLAGRGVASWNLEYRRVGHPGGGWPGTFQDLSDGTDFVRDLTKRFPLDPQRVVLVGHSSGGYFAAWLAGREHLPANSPLRRLSPLKLAGMVQLDSFLDPKVIDSHGTNGQFFCNQPILAGLIGGEPESVPAQLQQASPLTLLPYGIPQEYVVSSLRYPVTPPRPLAAGRTTYPVLDYPALAEAAGDTVNVQIVPDADHFDFMNSAKPAWPVVEAALVRIFHVK